MSGKPGLSYGTITLYSQAEARALIIELQGVKPSAMAGLFIVPPGNSVYKKWSDKF